MSTDKKMEHKGHKHTSPGVKLEKSVLERNPSYKVEGPSSPKREMRERPSQEEVRAELNTKAKEAAERYAQLLRLGAEFENYKKRVQKEISDLMNFGNESLLKAVLPILDNLERAIGHGKKMNENAPFLQGVEIILRQFLTILERFGVKPVAAMGESFDPEKHEAVSLGERPGARSGDLRVGEGLPVPWAAAQTGQGLGFQSPAGKDDRRGMIK